MAVRDGERLSVPFPHAFPVKKQAIMAALAMDDHINLSFWVTSVDARTRREDPELGLLCTQAEKAIRRWRSL